MNNQRFRVNTPTVTHETIDGEAVIINLDSGNYYSLVEVGSFIWGLVENGASVNEIQNHVLHTYEGAPPDVERSVLELFAQLQQENLIVPSNGAAEGTDSAAAVPANTQHAKPPFTPPLLHKYSDMQELLLLDPIHDVDDAGWPKPVPDQP